MYILIKTLPRDISILISILKIRKNLQKCHRSNCTLSKLFTQHVKMHPKKVAYYFEDEAWTFEKVERFSNRIANYFEREGYKNGDTIALLLDNCIEYTSIWLGLSKNGIAAALINTNLVDDSLLRSLETASCKAVIFGTSHFGTIMEVAEKLQTKKLYQFRVDLEEHEKLLGSVDLTKELNYVSDRFYPPEDLSIHDRLMYVFTSGTTGLPKAALITHLKAITMITVLKEIAEVTANDVIYTPLPLYHAAGGIVGTGMAFVAGSTVVIRKKFSATNYFNDCAKYNVTVGQYIGEVCRYLLASPESQTEKYRLRVLVGNGLKPQIWKKFTDRFRIQRIIEFYGATEGNAVLVNNDNTEGAVGFIPRYLKWACSTTNIECDEATGEPIRNKDGFCVECGVGKPGLVIANTLGSMMQCDGYTSKEESEKKLLHNVFRKGDTYFNTGDICEYDEFGYYYFVDRTGDSFRWKGENVSTSETEAIISSIFYFNDVAVYGVKIPHTDGTAGMAAILDTNRNLNIDTVAKSFRQRLPSYAIPVFLRIMDAVPLTGTFKLKKNDLKREGFNIREIEDNMFVYNSKAEKYVPLSNEIYDEIEDGLFRI